MLKNYVLIGEVSLQCQIAQRAAQRLDVANEKNDHIEIWCSIQSILIAGGNVSKILWPVKNKQRGKELRETLQVEQDNILSKRKFRNHFEHYDERIETYFEDKNPSVYSDLAMNPSMRGPFNFSHRGYNSFNKTLVFRDEVFDLGALLKALEEVRGKCGHFVLT